MLWESIVWALRAKIERDGPRWAKSNKYQKCQISLNLNTANKNLLNFPQLKISAQHIQIPWEPGYQPAPRNHRVQNVLSSCTASERMEEGAFNLGSPNSKVVSGLKCSFF